MYLSSRSSAGLLLKKTCNGARLTFKPSISGDILIMCDFIRYFFPSFKSRTESRRDSLNPGISRVPGARVDNNLRGVWPNPPARCESSMGISAY